MRGMKTCKAASLLLLWEGGNTTCQKTFMTEPIQETASETWESIIEKLPCSETLEFVSTIALLTLLHQAVATVSRIHRLHENKTQFITCFNLHTTGAVLRSKTLDDRLL